MEYLIEEDLFSKEKTLKWSIFRDDIKKEMEYTYLFFPLINAKWSADTSESVILISFNWEEGNPYVVLKYYCNQKGSSKKRFKDENIVFAFDNGDSYHLKIVKISNNKELYLTPFNRKGFDAILKHNIKGVSIPNVQDYIIGETLSMFLPAHLSLPPEKDTTDMREHLKSYLKVCKKEFGWKPEVPNIKTEQQGFSYHVESTCNVYLMLDSTNGYYKIGMSNNPEYREKTLLGEKPTISLLAYRKYPSRIIASSIENALHNAFSSKRVRGEWFRLDDYDVWQIKEVLK